jgi:hypothetical protein
VAMAAVKAACVTGWAPVAVQRVPLVFGWGQVAYATVLLAVYVFMGGGRARRQLMAADEDRAAVPWSLLGAFQAQGVVKHVLTEGDRLVLWSFGSETQRGVFAAAANYGSLAARLLFAPVEDGARTLFARLLLVADADRAAVRRVTQIFSLLVRVVILVGLFVAALGPHLALPVADLLLGPAWVAQNVHHALAAFAIYVPLLAINGIAEALASAVSDAQHVSYSFSWLLVCGVVSAVLAVLALPRAGIPGLVFSMACNMALRAGGALFIAHHALSARFGPHSAPAPLQILFSTLPRAATLVLFPLASYALHASLVAFPDATVSPLSSFRDRCVAHIPSLAAGTLAALALLSATFLLERDSLSGAIQALRDARARRE